MSTTGLICYVYPSLDNNVVGLMVRRTLYRPYEMVPRYGVCAVNTTTTTAPLALVHNVSTVTVVTAPLPWYYLYTAAPIL